MLIGYILKKILHALFDSVKNFIGLWIVSFISKVPLKLIGPNFKTFYRETHNSIVHKKKCYAHLPIAYKWLLQTEMTEIFSESFQKQNKIVPLIFYTDTTVVLSKIRRKVFFQLFFPFPTFQEKNPKCLNNCTQYAHYVCVYSAIFFYL